MGNGKLALKEYSSKLHKLYSKNIEKIILFGSRARGDDKEDSDIDILVVIKEEDRELKDKVTDLAFDMMLKYGVDVEPAIFNIEEWTKLTKHPTSFTHCVLNEGREL